MAGKHLVVVSFDAMVGEDLDLLREDPVFAGLLEKGARVSRISTVYPSLTYPAHTSMLTGARCGKHGVVNNEPADPGNLKCPWYWFHDPVKIPDIHDAARQAGLVTASVFWPVTGGHRSIDYLVAEYWAQGPDDTLEREYKRAGTSDELYQDIIRPLEGTLSSWDSTVTDDAKVQIACEMIRRYRPNLLTVHLGQIDSLRHKYGIFNDKVAAGVLKSGAFMGRIMQAARDAGTFADTDFVVCSDHGQINYTRRMNLNALFVGQGLTDTSWRVWAKTANFSAQVYLSDPEDKALEEQVSRFLHRCCEEGDKGIGRVLDADQARQEYGLYGDFSFVIESDGSTLFLSDWKEPLFSPAKCEPGYQRASHGHDPSTGPQPVFVGCGPHFRQGVVLSRAEIIDEAPTYARILGVKLPQAEGRPMTALLEKT